MKKWCAMLSVVALLSGCVVYPGYGYDHGRGNDRDFCHRSGQEGQLLSCGRGAVMIGNT
jgi:hypothetical protein